MKLLQNCISRHVSFLLVLLISTLGASASHIDEFQAQGIAAQFLNSRHGSIAGKRQVKAARLSLKAQEIQNQDIYVFNALENNGGYVVVAGDDAAPLVLGYSYNGTFDWDTAPDNLKFWIELNARYVEKCRNKATSVTRAAHKAGEVVVAPLLNDILWGQGDPYNIFCPTYQEGTTGKNYYVGCVATAATQIMRMHKYPAKGTGSKSCVVGGISLSANFGNTTYDWDNMLPSYADVNATKAQKEAVATLAAHFGVAVEMEYTPTGSGAHTMMVPGALRDYFGYDAGTTIRVRDYYDSEEWLNVIKRELQAGRPVLYGASSDVGQSGHAFVCDGYDSEGFVHINWGWTGKSNGYFLVNHLDPDDLGIGGGTGGYNLNQEIVTGIQRPVAGSVLDRALYSAMSMRLIQDNGDNFSLLASIENYDTKEFNGEIGVAAVRGDSMIALLKSTAQKIAGFANGKTGILPTFTMYNIPKTVGAGVADGAVSIRFVFREDASSPWKVMRYCRGRDSKGKPYVGSFIAEISNGKLGAVAVNNEHPDVVLLNKLEPQDEVLAQGSAMFSLKLNNNSKDVRLKNIVIRFTSVEDSAVHFDYENPVNIYDKSIESTDLIVNLDDSMPAGKYRLMAYEKGYEDFPFVESIAGDIIEVKPASKYPVMRLTQPVMWRRADGTETVNQGDRVYFAMNARNYGAPGNVGAILVLVDSLDNGKRYIYQQSDAVVAKGEAKTLTFYRKLPVDPGTYRVMMCYITDDGTIVDDSHAEGFNTWITVGKASDILLNAVSINLPETIVKGDRLTGSVTLKAPNVFQGTVYVRMRQYTLFNGGILNMKRMSFQPGEQQTLDISQAMSFDTGRYLVLVEAKQGSTEGTIGEYANCYKLINVVDKMPGTLGDLNHDGVINVSDVTALINMILGTSAPQLDIADMNGDGIINVSDVTALINIILAQ